MWTAADAETVSAAVYQRAGADPADPPGPVALARMLGVAVRRAPRRHLWGGAVLCHVDGRPEVWIAPGLAPELRGFLVAHELAELELQRQGATGEHVEALADAAAAGIVAPRAAYRAALRALGPVWPELAHAFVATQSLVALRWGEVTDEPIALVAPTGVRVRGDAAWSWPRESELRRIARAEAVPAELRRERLTDDRSRWVLRAA